MVKSDSRQGDTGNLKIFRKTGNLRFLRQKVDIRKVCADKSIAQRQWFYFWCLKCSVMLLRNTQGKLKLHKEYTGNFAFQDEWEP